MLGLDDLIPVSVDDHLIEPPDVFVEHHAANRPDRAPEPVSFPPRARRALAAGVAR